MDERDGVPHQREMCWLKFGMKALGAKIEKGDLISTFWDFLMEQCVNLRNSGLLVIRRGKSTAQE